MADDLERLATAHRILEKAGHGDLTLGHMALRDAKGRGFWLKRYGLGLGEVSGPQDFILLDFEGNKIDGNGERHKEWPIHAEIMRARPDVQVTAHTHPFYACLFSATREKLRPVTQDGTHFPDGIPFFAETSGLVDTRALGAAHACTLGERSAVFIINHGVSFCGDSIELTTLRGIFVERACRAQILLAASGLEWSVAPDFQGNSQRSSELLPPSNLKNHWDYLVRQLDLLPA